MELQGHIKLIGETQEYGKNGFLKREIVITTDEKYPQDLKIDFVQDKCKILDKYAEGQEVIIGINIRGNEYNGKYFVNLQGWKINEVEPQSAVDNYEEPEPELPNEPELPDDLNEEDEDDSLPF